MNLLKTLLHLSHRNETPISLQKTWIIEYQGKPIAKLKSPQHIDMFWTNYDLIPLVTEAEELTSLYSYENWTSNAFKFVSDDEEKLQKKAMIAGAFLNQINNFPRKIQLRGL